MRFVRSGWSSYLDNFKCPLKSQKRIRSMRFDTNYDISKPNKINTTLQSSISINNKTIILIGQKRRGEKISSSSVPEAQIHYKLLHEDTDGARGTHTQTRNDDEILFLFMTNDVKYKSCLFGISHYTRDEWFVMNYICRDEVTHVLVRILFVQPNESMTY